MDGGPCGHFIVALVAESGTLFDESQFLRVAVILVAGGALAAVDGVVDSRNFGKLVVAFEAFGLLRRRPGGETKGHDKGCRYNEQVRPYCWCHALVLLQLFFFHIPCSRG
jgi:hypothetical protein